MLVGEGRSSVTTVYRVRAFAELAGVTVRALHHYDQLKLLRPARTTSGYRTYGLRDLERLEQIVALRFLGLPLKQIKTVLDRDPRSMPETLRAQRRALEDKRRRLDQAIGAIADAEASIQPGRPIEAAVLKRIIEVIDMTDHGQDMKKYYSDEGWAEMTRRREEATDQTRSAAEEGTRKWQALFADVEASLGEDPAGPIAQALVDRWRALLHEFTGGHQEVAAGVGRAWKDRENWTAPMKRVSEPFADPRIWEFIRRASAARPA
jgi:MerR family transcriptional regulator, thiopeptide resistance regulator